MGRQVLVVDSRNCIGCHACEVACKQEHDIPAGGQTRIRVFTPGPKEIEGKVQLRYVVSYCMHCSHPPCKDSCPVNAINITDNGTVMVDKKACIGCGICITACPLGVMYFDPLTGIVDKCDLCFSRIENGLQPACITACPSHCMYFGDIDKITRIISDKRIRLRYPGIFE